MTTETRHTLTLPGPPVTVDLSAEEVCRYLLATGWKRTEEPNPAWTYYSSSDGTRIASVPRADFFTRKNEFVTAIAETIGELARIERRRPVDLADDIIARRPGVAPAEVLTDGQIAEIEARAHAATPGPWRPAGPDGDEVAQMGSARRIRSLEDAAFIAAARTDVPALLTEIRRLRAANADLHRRAQTAEGIIARSGIVEGRQQTGRGGLGRALANYAAAQATRERDEALAKLEAWRAYARAVQEAQASVPVGAWDARISARERAWDILREVDPEGTKELKP